MLEVMAMERIPLAAAQAATSAPPPASTYGGVNCRYVDTVQFVVSYKVCVPSASSKREAEIRKIQEKTAPNSRVIQSVRRCPLTLRIIMNIIHRKSMKKGAAATTDSQPSLPA
ncbi:hypothetical protein D3C76_1157170 [compost metagenome]